MVEPLSELFEFFRKIITEKRAFDISWIKYTCHFLVSNFGDYTERGHELRFSLVFF